LICARRPQLLAQPPEVVAVLPVAAVHAERLAGAVEHLAAELARRARAL
jgi:hypothetical protein